MIILEKSDWLIRHVETDDEEILVKWLSDPRVLKFYEGRDNPFDSEKVKNKFIEGNDHLERCIIEYEGKKIGYIQIYPLDEETQQLYGISGDHLYGMDQFIGEPAYWDKGLGTELVSTMTKFLREERQAVKIYMDPQLRNHRALRCYEKAGFAKVKVLPQHELHEGEYQDCWLVVFPAE